MKTLIRFFALLCTLTAIRCASVPPNSVKLSSKWDQSNNQTIQSVYIKTSSFSEKDEAMYEAVIGGFKKSLLQKGVNAQDDFLNGSMETPDSAKVSFRPDAVLVLGQPFWDVKQGPVLPVPHGAIMRTKSKQQRFQIQLVNPATQRDIWVGEVSFVPYDAKYVGHKVVREWAAAGLLETVK